MAYDEKLAARARQLLSGRTDLVEKKMMGGLCFMVKGRMCASASGRGGLLVRVGPDAYQAMLGEPHVAPMGMGKRMMTGFVRVTPEGYRTEAGLKKWIKRGLDFVATMPSGAPAREATKGKAVKRPRTKKAKA
jgi:TfoX N-terminal domain